MTDLLKLVDLVDKAFLFPHQLSGGEAQRVSIARALSVGPQLIFADEPTGNLDPESSRGVVQLLQKINQLGTTVLITSHDLLVLDILKGERHLQLDKGKLIKDSGSQMRQPADDQPASSTGQGESTATAPRSKLESAAIDQSDQPAVEVADTPQRVEPPVKESPVTAKESSPPKRSPDEQPSTPTTVVPTPAQPKRRIVIRLPKISWPFLGKKKTESDGHDQTESHQTKPIANRDTQLNSSRSHKKTDLPDTSPTDTGVSTKIKVKVEKL